MTRITVGIALTSVLAAGSALAHHDAAALGTVHIAQTVLAGGQVLQPGTYELRDTGEHTKPLPGQSAEAQTYIEFVANGRVVAREAAEIMPGEPSPVGTSGRSSEPRAQLLKEGEFLRISMFRDGERYLVYLPTGQ